MQRQPKCARNALGYVYARPFPLLTHNTTGSCHLDARAKHTVPYSEIFINHFKSTIFLASRIYVVRLFLVRRMHFTKGNLIFSAFERSIISPLDLIIDSLNNSSIKNEPFGCPQGVVYRCFKSTL